MNVLANRANMGGAGAPPPNNNGNGGNAGDQEDATLFEDRMMRILRRLRQMARDLAALTNRSYAECLALVVAAHWGRHS